MPRVLPSFPLHCPFEEEACLALRFHDYDTYRLHVVEQHLPFSSSRREDSVSQHGNLSASSQGQRFDGGQHEREWTAKRLQQKQLESPRWVVPRLRTSLAFAELGARKGRAPSLESGQTDGTEGSVGGR